MNIEEFSFDLDEKSVENLKKTINYDEIETRHKRFMNGTETIDDLINGILHYRIKNDDGLDLDVVEFKYYQKMIDLYEKEKEISHYNQSQLDIANSKLVEEKEKNKKLDKENQGLFELYNFNDSSLLTKILKDYKNIIKKQSKEIEEYKKQLDLDYVDKHFVPIERYYQLEKEIEELDKENTRQHELIGNIHQKWKDKIKAKIDKLQSRIDQMHPASDCVIIDDLENQIEVLQSLLKEE